MICLSAFLIESLIWQMPLLFYDCGISNLPTNLFVYLVFSVINVPECFSSSVLWERIFLLLSFAKCRLIGVCTGWKTFCYYMINSKYSFCHLSIVRKFKSWKSSFVTKDNAFIVPYARMRHCLTFTLRYC